MATTRERVQEIFRDVFDEDELELQDAWTAKDVEGWDSLNNVKLMVRVEGEFGIKFKTGEIVELRNVGDLLALIERKVASKAPGR